MKLFFTILCLFNNFYNMNIILDHFPNLSDDQKNKFLELVENNVKVVFLGDTKPIDRDIVSQMKKLEKATRNNDGLILNIALNYSGRDEIIRVTKKIASDCKSENLKIKDINDNLFQKYLDTKNQKDPDLIIRTAGNQRISNFLLWQIAYSELYFTETYWPDFSEEDFTDAIIEYQKRERRCGKTA